MPKLESQHIEAWARGVERIFEACRVAGAPEPLLRYGPNDLWLEFPFSADYVKALGGARAASAHGTEQVTEQVARFVALLHLQRRQHQVMIHITSISLTIW